MPGPILPISSAAIPQTIAPAGNSASGGAFQDIFTSAVERVEGLQANAAASMERFLSGDNEDLHTTILAATQADLSFNLFLQSRNKVVSAYQEIMRLQI
ncbi:MAG TPA: flagellar hook-basal body complex protein FliE [Verrucomicrobiae bacterium]|nr:flagellar hook-basal body complex protein FliE [Verrucomicrobiae bacterium]